MAEKSKATNVECDVCIVGAGPAGLALAYSLEGHGVNTVLLESGARDAAGASSDSNSGTSSDSRFGSLVDSRSRGVGGTSIIWTTIRHGEVGAKYIPLRPLDLQQRSVTDWSGWPFGYEELERWYPEAHLLAGLPAYDRSCLDLRDPALHLLPFGSASLTTGVYHWGPASSFTRVYELLRQSERVIVQSNATASSLKLDPDGATVSAVEWRSSDGDSGSVKAKRVVLAAGAVENARLLLTHYAQIGQQHPEWLGRGFMEHPSDRSMQLTSRHPALSPDPGIYAFQGTDDRSRLIGGIGLSTELMEEEGLRAANLRLHAVRHSRPMRLLRKLSGRVGAQPMTRYNLILDLEQAPHPDNRITLGSELDRLGLPRVHLNWSWRQSDEANRLRVVDVITREFERARAGSIGIAVRSQLDPDVHHHAGTTRAGDDRDSSVVNADLRMHGHPNLYVVGGSVFPTAGFANPTLTILALSIRLANHLAANASN